MTAPAPAGYPCAPDRRFIDDTTHGFCFFLLLAGVGFLSSRAILVEEIDGPVLEKELIATPDWLRCRGAEAQRGFSWSPAR